MSMERQIIQQVKPIAITSNTTMIILAVITWFILFLSVSFMIIAWKKENVPMHISKR